MEVIYGLIPGMILLGLVAVIILFWAARSGQFDDLEGDGQRILMDEDAVDPRRIPDGEEEFKDDEDLNLEKADRIGPARGE